MVPRYTARESNLSDGESPHVTHKNLRNHTKNHFYPVSIQLLLQVKMFILMSWDLIQLVLTVIGNSELFWINNLATRTLRVCRLEEMALQRVGHILHYQTSKNIFQKMLFAYIQTEARNINQLQMFSNSYSLPNFTTQSIWRTDQSHDP